MTLHAVLFVALACMFRETVMKGNTHEAARGTGLALVQTQQRRSEYAFESSDAADSASSSSASGLPQVAQAVAADVPQLPTTRELGALPASSAGLPAAGALTASGQPSRGIGGQTTTGVFGVHGTGSRFVYVFDRSSSMEGYGGKPLAVAKEQLIASLEQLEEIHQFQIVFYNERTSVFNPLAPQPARLMYGNDQTKRQAERYIRTMVGSGGTLHFEAIKLALDMQPDVVFFLTDGSENPISRGQLEQIRQRNERIGASIHTIEFGVESSRRSPFLVQLAEQNNGQYTYVNVARLPFPGR
jgi:hypothetical protein